MDKCEFIRIVMILVVPLLLLIYTIITFLTFKRELDEIATSTVVSSTPTTTTKAKGQQQQHHHHHHHNRHRHRGIYNMYMSWVKSLRPISLRDCTSDLTEWRKLTPETLNNIVQLLHGLVAWDCSADAVATISSDELRFLVQKHLHTKSIQRGVIRSYCNAMRFDGRQVTSPTPTTTTVDSTVMMLTIAQYLHFVSSITILGIMTTKFRLTALWNICERISHVDSLYIEMLATVAAAAAATTNGTQKLAPVVGHVERAVKNQLDYFTKIVVVDDDMVRPDDICVFLKFTVDNVLQRLNCQRYYNVSHNPFEKYLKTNSLTTIFDKENIYLYDKKILTDVEDEEDDDDHDDHDDDYDGENF